METHMIISLNIGYIAKNEIDKLQFELEKIIRMLTGLIKTLSNRLNDKL
jgi:four helix bundle protein